MEFPENCPSEFLLVAGSERGYSESFLSNTKKASQDQEKTILCTLQAGFSKKI